MSSVRWTVAAIKAGADGFLAKPFDLVTVDELVRGLLENNADPKIANGNRVGSGKSA